MSLNIYKSIVDYVIRKADEERIIQNPVFHQDKYDQYCRTLLIAQAVFGDDVAKVQLEDPRIPYDNHCVVINLLQNDFEDDQYKQLVSFMSNFDGVSIVYNADELRIVLQFVGIYTDKGKPN